MSRIRSLTWRNIINLYTIASTDEVINKEPIRCSANDTFAEIEEKLYKKHNDFRNTNNHHICNGRNILRFKTLIENKIKDEDVVLITKLE